MFSFITRRYFLKFLGLSGMDFFVFPLNDMASFIEMKNRIRNRFKPPVVLPPDSKRAVTKLPPEGLAVSVETALNSRCTSDYDENPELFHWGMFNKEEKLSPEQINQIAGHITIPPFTNHRAEVKVEGNTLTFLVDNTVSGIEREWLMIESGMQQQAACLICAALGVGMVFKSYGKDGRKLSEKDYANVRIKLDAMKPTYAGSYWSSLPPDGRRPWLKGNLPNPDRKGNHSLIETLSRLIPQNRNSNPLREESLSQLLWAARGRTPHLYKSKAWGMTIPVSRGAQNITSLYLLSDNKLYKYVNWSKNRPTHSVALLNPTDKRLYQDLLKEFPSGNCFVVFGKNETHQRALWEVGYQLLNLLLQAQALGQTYSAIFLNDTQKKIFQKAGIKAPVAAVMFVKPFKSLAPGRAAGDKFL